MIPVNEPLLGEKESEYVRDCIASGWISSRGSYIDAFEKRFSEYCGTAHGITTTNGTTALHLALLTLGIGPGDRVILPTFTMAATAFAVLYTGAVPVLVDVDPETGNIDPLKVKDILDQAKIGGEKTIRALLPVHIYGHPVDMDPLKELAREYDLLIIEDAAEAHGAEYKGKKTGGLGDMGCFSFYANKIITTGEGGMVVTNHPDWAERARSLKDLAHAKDQRFLHFEIGFNFRMTNLQAALGLAQLERIEEFLQKKQWMARAYAERLKDMEGVRLPVEKPWAQNVYWMYGILIDQPFPLKRDAFARELSARQIETRNFFVPMHRQPVMQPFINTPFAFRAADYWADHGLYLPSGLAITESQIDQVCEAIRALENRKK